MMWKVPIVMKNCHDQKGSGNHSPQCGVYGKPLPVFYMQDYSVLGLNVDRLENSLEILKEAGFPVEDTVWGPEVLLQHPSQAVSALDLLGRRGVSAELADLIDGVYQG
ncbi:MAG: hypothetical protein GX443_04690 [Deltaproteobacteria bacterium]|nr:hypothetical protein [Deltaproteobacteria bacterium]